MFNLNLITCDYPLPILGEQLEEIENPPDWSEMEFHLDHETILSDHLFSKYSIEADGQIYEERVDFTVGGDPTDPVIEQVGLGIEKKEYTGELIFHGVHLDKDHDFVMTFKSLFWKGDLKEIELVEWDKKNNSERVKLQERARKEFQNKIAEKKKWWYKPYVLFSSVLRSFLVLAARLLGFFLRIVSDIEVRLAR